MFELDESRCAALIEQWARRIVERGFGALAVFLLEAHKPVAPLGAHAVLAFQPLLDALLPVNAGELAAFLNHTDNLERLARRVEELAAERDAALTAARRRRAKVRERARGWRRLRRRNQ